MAEVAQLLAAAGAAAVTIHGRTAEQRCLLIVLLSSKCIESFCVLLLQPLTNPAVFACCHLSWQQHAALAQGKSILAFFSRMLHNGIR